MKTLIYEDFYTLKSHFLILIAILVIYGIVFIPSSGYTIFLLVATSMFSIALVTRSLSYDEMTKWPKQALVMPITRKEYVFNKYFILLLSTVVGLIIGLLIDLVFILIKGGGSFNELNTLELILTFTYPIITGSLTICLSFIFGFDKAKLIALVTYLLPAGLLYFIQDYINISFSSIESFISMSPIIALVILGISYFVSLYFFKKKEF